MGDPFSLAAGSFAVVGIVDVVLRASIECCRFLSALKDAPEEITRLCSCIETNKSLVESFKKHFDRLQSLATALPTTDTKEALKLFESSVKSFDRELSNLKLLETRYKARKKIWSSIKYHLDDRKVHKCFRNLENAKSGLCAALSLVGGPSTLFQGYMDSVIEKGVQQVTTISENLRKDLSVSYRKQTESSKIQEETLINSKETLKSSKLLAEDLRNTAQATRIQHVETRAKITEGNQMIINTIRDGFANLRINMPSGSLCDKEIHFVGESKDVLLDLLVLAKTQIRTAEALATAHHVDIGWLQNELRMLVRSTVQEMNPESSVSTTIPPDRWLCSSRVSTMRDLGRTISTGTVHCQSDAVSDVRSPLSMDGKANEIFPRNPFKILFHESSVGRLYLITHPHLEHGPPIRGSKEARILFIPSIDIHESSLAIRFLETCQSTMKSISYVQLTTFRLVNSITPYRDLIPQGSVEQIDRAIRNGIISPYDQSRTGCIFCFRLIGSHFRLDLLRYFQNQGMGVSKTNGENDVLSGMLNSIRSSDLDCVSQSSVEQILAFLNEYSPHAIAPIDADLLHGYHWHPRREVTGKRMQMIRLMLKFLKMKGYDFENLDRWQRTPLLGNMITRGGSSLAMAKIILELGADAHAIDVDGRNTIQLAMCFNIVWKPEMVSFQLNSKEFPEILPGKFELLINAGVNLEHRDIYGSTPSMDAINYQCWNFWCKALKRCGKSIDEVSSQGEAKLAEE